MTAKQKANQARFKKVVAEAKKLRKKNPKLTQAQAVKQAWAMTYSKKDVSVGATNKKAKYKYEVYNGGDELMQSFVEKDRALQLMSYLIRNGFEEPYYVKYNGKIISEQKLGAIKKKSKTTKVKAKKGKRTSEMHTDTKSHNVNIRVMSGIKKISGIPHKAKYYIKTKKNGIEHIEYFDKMPQGYYKGMDRILYLTRFEDAGTVLTPIRYAKNDKEVKK